MENNNELQKQDGPAKNGHHALIATLVAVLSVIMAAIIFMVVWYWGDSYPDMDDFKQAMDIPGLDEGATPAGIEVFKPTTGTYSSEEMYFVAANMKDGTSRIYVTGKTHGYYGYVTLADADGEPFTEGVNGIALDNYTMWVASGTTIYVDHSSTNNAVINDIINKAIANEAYLNPSEDESDEDEEAAADASADAEDEEYEIQSVEFTGSFAANCNADFIFLYYGTSTNYLYVGETRSSSDITRRVVTDNGDTNTGLMLAYQESTGATYGLVNLSDTYDADGDAITAPKITSAYSIPSNITGVAVTDSAGTNEIALVQDNGYASSTLLAYNFSSSSGVAKTNKTYANMYGNSFRYDGLYQKAGSSYTDSSIKVYTVDSGNLDNEYTLPALAGELAVGSNDETIYVLFKSGASAYKALVRQATKEVYRIDLPGRN